MNDINNFSILPEDCKLIIFSEIPKESAIVLPFVSKIFLTSVYRNDLWDKIATRYNVKNLKLDFAYDKNESKFSFLMRNKEIVNMFINRKYNGNDELEIDIYNPINELALEILNRRINKNQTYFPIFNNNHSHLKHINFMLDTIQKPEIMGYVKPFLNNKEAIYIVMDKFKVVLEKEYKIHKKFLQQIEYYRELKNKPAPLKMNSIEKEVRKITTSYEKAVEIFDSRNNI